MEHILEHPGFLSPFPVVWTDNMSNVTRSSARPSPTARDDEQVVLMLVAGGRSTFLGAKGIRGL
jgi:hypothetical protein